MHALHKPLISAAKSLFDGGWLLNCSDIDFASSRDNES